LTAAGEKNILAHSGEFVSRKHDCVKPEFPMCLAVPMKVLRINENRAVVEDHGIEIEAGTVLCPDVKVDDMVLVHAGFIIEKLDLDEARAIEEAWEEYYRTPEA